MTGPSLEGRLQRNGSASHMLQNAQVGAYVFPIPPQYTNWVEEVRAWRNGAVLLNQSYHMTDLYVRGPDTVRFLSHVGVNSFAGFGRNKAKQLVCCNPDGFVIGDGILFGLEDDEALFIGRPPLAHWMIYQAQIGPYDVTTEIDIRSLENADKPTQTLSFRGAGAEGARHPQRGE